MHKFEEIFVYNLLTVRFDKFGFRGRQIRISELQIILHVYRKHPESEKALIGIPSVYVRRLIMPNLISEKNNLSTLSEQPLGSQRQIE